MTSPLADMIITMVYPISRVHHATLEEISVVVPLLAGALLVSIGVQGHPGGLDAAPHLDTDAGHYHTFERLNI